MVASATKTQRVRLSRWTFNVANPNGEVKGVFLAFERTEESENMTNFARFESTLRVLNLKDSKVMILFVELFESSHINIVLKFCDTKVFDFNWVRDGPFKTNRYRR